MAQVLSVVAVALDGVAYTGTDGLTVSKIRKIRPATSGEMLAFPSALTRIFYEDKISGRATNGIQTYLTATATAAVIAACNT